MAEEANTVEGRDIEAEHEAAKQPIKLFYSASKNSFFSTLIFRLDELPTDSVEITEKKYGEVFAAQAAGKNIAPGKDGLPTAIDPPAFPMKVQMEDMRITRNSLLLDTDGLVNRHRDELDLGVATTLSDADFKKLLQYRVDLRNVPANVTDPKQAKWPVPPK